MALKKLTQKLVPEIFSQLLELCRQFIGQGSFVLASAPGMYPIAENIQKILRKKHGLNIKHVKIGFKQFANGELLPEIPESVRGQHVFFLIALQHPDPNQCIMKMLLAHDALNRASAKGITLIAPLLPYGRQDRKHKGRVPISARLLADQIETNRAVERVVSVDLHAPQQQGFFSIPVDDLSSVPVLAKHIKSVLGDKLKNAIVVGPDFGSAVRNRHMAHKLGVNPFALYEKRRTGINQAEVVSFIGDPVKGKIVIMHDDMIDTGGTILGTAKHALDQGAIEVYVLVTHGLFNGPAVEVFKNAGVHVICTNTIPRDDVFIEENASWLTYVPMDEMLADAIWEATAPGGSISKLSQ